MLVGDQNDAIGFLRNLPRSGGAEVEFISTHASLIFLVGEHAFKMKRAVRYPYLDFSTPEKRLACCRAELELNRRTAPNLYIGVRTITRAAGEHLEFNGTGPLVDAVVEMRRFGQEALFDTMARDGSLTKQHMTALAREIARLHRSAPVSFEHKGRSYSVAADDASINVEAMPNDLCCKMPNLVWYSPLVGLENRKVGYTARAEYSGKRIGTPWSRSGENSAFYGSFSL